MRTPTKFSVSHSLLFLVTALLTVGIAAPVKAVTTRTFTEKFSTTRYRDTVNTTAVWDTTAKQVSLEPIDLTPVQGDFDGATVDRVMWCGAKWIITTAFNVYTYDGRTLSNLTEPVIIRGVANRDRPEVACNNGTTLIHYQTYGGATFTRVILKYDGTTLTTLPDFRVNADRHLLPRTVDGRWVFGYGGSLWLYDGSQLTPVEIVDREEDLGGDDFVLVVNPVYRKLFKVRGTKALDLTAALSVRQISTAEKIGDTWYIGAGYLPDPDIDLGNQSLLTYDGKKFKDLTKEIGVQGVGDIAGTEDFLLLNVGYALVRYDGNRFWPYISNIPFHSLGWNGSYWVAGSFLHREDNSGLYRIDPEFADRGQVQSKKVNAATGPITSATLTATESTVTQASVRSQGASTIAVAYYLSNNGGKTWTRAKSGARVTFRTSGKDLRWKAVMTTRNSAVSPVIKSVTIKYR